MVNLISHQVLIHCPIKHGADKLDDFCVRIFPVLKSAEKGH